MSKPNGEKEAGNKSRFLNGPGVAYELLFSHLKENFKLQSAWIVTTAPRGSLQLIQPAGVEEKFFKAYTRTLAVEDALTWQVINRRQALRLSDMPGAIHFAVDLQQLTGAEWVAAAPLRAPLFSGFSGALHIVRQPGEGNFSDHELTQLLHLARELDRAIDHQRQVRRSALPLRAFDPSRRISHRLFAFRGDGRSILADAAVSVFDSHLQQRIVKYVRERMEVRKGDKIKDERVLLPDEYGELWVFHSVCYPSYPGLSTGPVLVLSVEPGCPEYALLRPDDFAADPETVRLAPAMQFMLKEYQRMPTLTEISRSVYLSPFHFHRRFSEVFGITPKHFLLECQVYEAKIQLMARDKELVQIARDCGFAHQSHFTSRFKQVTGLTPTRWRRMIGERLKGP